jgi:hypothetical protein
MNLKSKVQSPKSKLTEAATSVEGRATGEERRILLEPSLWRRGVPSPRDEGVGRGPGLASTHVPRWQEVNPKGIPSLSPGLASTHVPRWQEVNPKGIPSLSPGLRGTSYPGCDRSKESPTLKGLQHLTGTAAAPQKPAPCCNPFRVEHGSGTQPRVARASQPWAGGYNPLGIEKRRADLWVMTKARERGFQPHAQTPLPQRLSGLRWYSQDAPGGRALSRRGSC